MLGNGYCVVILTTNDSNAFECCLSAEMPNRSKILPEA